MTMMFQQIYKYFFFKSNAIKYVCDVDQNMHFNQTKMDLFLQLPTSEVCVVFLCVFLMCSLKIVRENLLKTLYHMQNKVL